MVVPHAGERGFTLIELLVAMVLMAVVLGIVGTALVSSISGSGSASAGALSDAAITRTVDRMADDIASAETADRAAGLVRDQDGLNAALRQGTDLVSSDPGLAVQRVVDLEDVVEATPTRFRVKADVVGGAADGIECVTWEAITTGTAYEVVRTVQRACGGAQIDRRVMLRANAAAAGVNPSPFSYRLMCHQTTCVGSSAVAAAPCRPWLGTTVSSSRDLRRIVGISATFTTNQNSGRSVAEGRGVVSMTIRSRDTGAWRTGLGC